MSKKVIEQLKHYAMPLMQFIRENYSPHHQVTVSDSAVVLHELTASHIDEEVDQRPIMPEDDDGGDDKPAVQSPKNQAHPAFRRKAIEALPPYYKLLTRGRLRRGDLEWNEDEKIWEKISTTIMGDHVDQYDSLFAREYKPNNEKKQPTSDMGFLLALKESRAMLKSRRGYRRVTSGSIQKGDLIWNVVKGKWENALLIGDTIKGCEFPIVARFYGNEIDPKSRAK